NTCISPLIKYRYHYYKIHEDFVILKRLFIFKKEELSKIERIQFIDIGTNPLSKKLNLNSITLFTAGHIISFPIISEKEAQNIQQQILLRLRGANDDV
ncbi:PH domain-containing protein, partial [Staphylococcus epidermidis]|nr:PH domain-containing protein [Staphylococcus epidermidis]